MRMTLRKLTLLVGLLTASLILAALAKILKERGNH